MRGNCRRGVVIFLSLLILAAFPEAGFPSSPSENSFLSREPLIGPLSPLYPLKLSLEHVSVALLSFFSKGGRSEALMQKADERLVELASLARRNSTETSRVEAEYSVIIDSFLETGGFYSDFSRHAGNLGILAAYLDSLPLSERDRLLFSVVSTSLEIKASSAGVVPILESKRRTDRRSRAEAAIAEALVRLEEYSFHNPGNSSAAFQGNETLSYARRLFLEGEFLASEALAKSVTSRMSEGTS